tara:strand:+ start:436 stop:795 length:360 start_codon:yes stop_codon:yes gene_type:complete
LTKYSILLSLALTQVGCAHSTSQTIGWTDNGAPIVRPKTQTFPILDNRGILHEYKSDYKTYKRITHPKSDKLTLYCGVHFQWEIIRIAWKRGNITNIAHREEMEYWRWTYTINKAKKQF